MAIRGFLEQRRRRWGSDVDESDPVMRAHLAWREERVAAAETEGEGPAADQGVCRTGDDDGGGASEAAD